MGKGPGGFSLTRLGAGCRMVALTFARVHSVEVGSGRRQFCPLCQEGFTRLHFLENIMHWR